MTDDTTKSRKPSRRKPTPEELDAVAIEPYFPPTWLWVASGAAITVTIGVAGIHILFALIALPFIAIGTLLVRKLGYVGPKVDRATRQRYGPAKGAMGWTLAFTFSLLLPLQAQRVFRESLAEPVPPEVAIMTAVVAGLVGALAYRRAHQYDLWNRIDIRAKESQEAPFDHEH